MKKKKSVAKPFSEKKFCSRHGEKKKKKTHSHSPMMRQRRLVLCALDWTRAKDPPCSLGHASILASLAHRNLPVTSLQRSVVSPEFEPIRFAEEILSLSNDQTDVAFGAFVWNEADLQSIMNHLKSNKFSGRIILGGPQVSYAEKGLLEKAYPQADVFVRGYGEQAICDLMTQEPGASINGVHWAGTEDREQKGQPELDLLPSPYLSGILPLQPFMRWETQRGCPFSCSFCQHRSAADKRRFFCQKRILQEAALLCNGTVTDLAVLDPTFNSGDRHMDVLRAFEDFRFKGKLSLQCRPEMLKPEFVEQCARINQNGAKVTLEFGLQTVHKSEWSAINRPNNLRAVEDAFVLLQKFNIHFEVSLIFGLPLQTSESFLSSVNWCLERSVPVLKAWPLMLLRGTRLDVERSKWGLVEEVDSSALNELHQEGVGFGRALRIMKTIPHVVASNSFSRNDWKKMCEVSLMLRLTEGKHPRRIMQ